MFYSPLGFLYKQQARKEILPQRHTVDMQQVESECNTGMQFVILPISILPTTHIPEVRAVNAINALSLPS